MDTKLRFSHFNPTTNKCEITPQQTPEDPDSTSTLVTLTATAFFTSLALTFPLSILLVSLLRLYTRPMVLLSAAITALLPLGICVSLFSWCLGVSEGCATLGPVSKQIFLLVVLPAYSALLAYELRKDWMGRAFENGIQALSMATEFLKEHFGLLIVNPVMLMVWMVFVNGPILKFMWYAFNVGEIVPDFDVVNDPLKGCELATGSPCCREERPGWGLCLYHFRKLHGFWGTLGVNLSSTNGNDWHCLALVLCTDGLFHQWQHQALSEVRNAYCSSFGTACNQSTIVTSIVVSLVGRLKKISDQVLTSNRQSSILRGCFLRMSQFPECHPRYAFLFASISGDSFWESSKKSHILLLRTQLPSTPTTKGPFHYSTIETLARMTLICALLQIVVVYAVLEYFSNAASETKFLIAVSCFPMIMNWLGSVFFLAVSSVFSSMYLCYAMEKDVGEVSKPEDCHALVAIPPSLPENEA